MSKITDKTKPMHEPVNDDELKMMMDYIHYCTAGSWYSHVRAAGNALLAGRAAPELKSMHEPVTADEADRFRYDFNRHKEATEHDFMARRLALDDFLARRAAVPRSNVVVTEAMIRECETDWLAHGRIQMPMDYCRFALVWMARHLNRKHAEPVDSRRKMIETIINDARSNPYDITTDEIVARIIAKLDEVKR